MTAPSGLGVVSVMAAPFSLSWLRLATSSSARFGAASPTYLCERFPTLSPAILADARMRCGRPQLPVRVKLWRTSPPRADGLIDRARVIGAGRKKADAQASSY